MTYIQHNSPFAKQKGGGTTKTCLPASKIRSMSKEQREKLVNAKRLQELKVNINDHLKQM